MHPPLRRMPSSRLLSPSASSSKPTNPFPLQSHTGPAKDSLGGLLSQLKACSPPLLPRLHARILKTQFSKDPFLLTRLAHAYLTADDLRPAKRILMGFPEKAPIFLWNETIKGYCRAGCFRESVELYYSMVERGVRPNEFTFTFVLPACAGGRSALDGRRIHKNVVRVGCEGNVFVATALVDMYGRCGELSMARKIFDGMPDRKTPSFNALIAGHVLNGEFNEAISIFNQMQNSGLQADAMTMVSVLKAYASLGALQQGRRVHEEIIGMEIGINVYLAAALINMYGRCGNIEESRRVFDGMTQKDLIVWTAIISSYGMHGFAEAAESLFNQMVQTGIRPDNVAFVGLLSGFSHRGMVDSGQKYFQKMIDHYRIKPSLEHYSCMVDMLGRAGRLTEAEELVRTMAVKPDSVIWGGLLNACKIHGNVEIAERVIEEVLRLDPSNAGWYVLMSNIYATARQWNGVTKMRTLMKVRKVIKHPGWSWIEIKGQIYRFLVFDRSHPRSDAIYSFIKDLEERMQAEGYVAETRCVLGNVDEDEKGEMLCGHSERLAIAFGILNTEQGEVLRVMKNLRVCADCHTVTKFISKVERREIIVRDARRFHHFKDGLCSCGDYW